MSEDRLQKLLAQAGVASRRAAEQLIAEGRVTVNGAVVDQPGSTASLERDVIALDGRPLVEREALVYFMLHKPPGVITTVRDPRRRRTARSLLRGVSARVYPVGRLDEDSEGLLLLTNDGELTHRLTHPRFGVEKEYLVELDAGLSTAELDRIREGVESRGDLLRPRQVRQSGEDQRAFSVILTEGKKREVRRMFETAGRRVQRLRRIRFGPLTLGDLEPGAYRPLTKDEIERLRAVTSG